MRQIVALPPSETFKHAPPASLVNYWADHPESNHWKRERLGFAYGG